MTLSMTAHVGVLAISTEPDVGPSPAPSWTAAERDLNGTVDQALAPPVVNLLLRVAALVVRLASV